MSSTNTHNGQNHHHHGQFITLLHNLGSKEVECHVQLTVHSVSDLPVKSGQFRVRWKFRDIDAKLAKQHRKAAAALKAKEHQATLSQAASQPESQTTSTTASSSDTEDRDKPANEHTPNDTSRKQPRPRMANESANAVMYSSEERGQTDYARMRKRDHTVTYEHTVDVIARMRVYKGELNSEPLKLVVEQLPSEIDTESYRGPPLRTGHRYVNLAEFVNEGKLRRKYLLENSKTNAMISVSLDITVVKAQAEFTKPVLRQDHILIGRKESPSHPRSIAGSTHPTSTTVVLSRASLDHSSTSASTVSSSSTSSRDSAPRPHHSTTAEGRSPQSTRLSTANDTEAIIEALFNPPVFSSSTHVPLSGSNRTQSSRSTTSGRSVTTTTAEHSILNSIATPYEYSARSNSRVRVGAAAMGEFGGLRRESADSNGAGTGMETNVTRRPSVATTATTATSSSGGWGGDDEQNQNQNQNQNQSQRGRLLGKLKKPFTISVTRRTRTPTPGDSHSGSGRDLNSSSASIGGRKRSSLDIVYSAPGPASAETKTPTLTADAPAPQVRRQMYHPSPKTNTRTLLAVSVPAQ